MTTYISITLWHSLSSITKTTTTIIDNTTITSTTTTTTTTTNITIFHHHHYHHQNGMKGVDSERENRLAREREEREREKAMERDSKSGCGVVLCSVVVFCVVCGEDGSIVWW